MPLVMTKCKHYWLWSDQPNCGKTTFMKEVAHLFRASWYSPAEMYQNIHADSQFILIDEYSHAHMKVTQLNQMCDGTYQYPLKGGQSKSVNAVIICAGNRHPRDVYPNAYKYIEARFNVHELGATHASIAPHQVIK